MYLSNESTVKPQLRLQSAQFHMGDWQKYWLFWLHVFFPIPGMSFSLISGFYSYDANILD